MEAGKRDMTQVFNRVQERVIPFFQRSYVWKEGNWDRLLDDLEKLSEQKEPYFMGVIVLKQLLTPTDAPDQRIVIDGQQRMTTLNVFFRVAGEIQDKLETIRPWFFDNYGKPILQHNHIDREIFEAIIQGKLDKAIREKYINNQVLKCYDWFLKNRSRIENLDIIQIYEKLFFVGIDLGINDDEQKIFDTINSLGVRLTTAELLKNDLFREEDINLFENTWKVSFEPESDLEVNDYWSTVLSSGRTYRTAIDLFLQSFIIVKSDLFDKQFRVDDLFANYRIWIKDFGVQESADKKREFAQMLSKTADLFRNNVPTDVIEREIGAEDRLGRLVLISFAMNMATFLPYLLYVLEDVEEPEEQEKIFSLIEAFIMRRFVTGMTTKGYNLLFSNLVASRVKTANDLTLYFREAKSDTEKFPSDAELSEAFHKYSQYNITAKTSLYLLELSMHDKKDSTKLLPFKSYSLEHIMPKKWRNHWNGLSVEESQERDHKLLTFGNLSLLNAKLNISVRDSNWETKKTGLKDKGGLLAHASGLKTLQPYLELENWDEEQIMERANSLAKHACEVWRLDN